MLIYLDNRVNRFIPQKVLSKSSYRRKRRHKMAVLRNQKNPGRKLETCFTVLLYFISRDFYSLIEQDNVAVGVLVLIIF